MDQAADEEASQDVVEKVTGKRVHGSRLQYRIKWQGFPAEESSWEDLVDCAGWVGLHTHAAVAWTMFGYSPGFLCLPLVNFENAARLIRLKVANANCQRCKMEVKVNRLLNCVAVSVFRFPMLELSLTIVTTSYYVKK